MKSSADHSNKKDTTSQQTIVASKQKKNDATKQKLQKWTKPWQDTVLIKPTMFIDVLQGIKTIIRPEDSCEVRTRNMAILLELGSDTNDQAREHFSEDLKAAVGKMQRRI